MATVLSPMRGLTFDALSLAVTVGIAFALSGDAEATSTHRVASWSAVGVAALPLFAGALRGHGSVMLDVVAGLGLGAAAAGSYAIGGLALLMPIFLLCVAGVLNYLATPRGARALGLERGKPGFNSGIVLTALGAFLGLSLSPLAFLGWVLSFTAIWLLARYLAEGRRRRGASPGLAWVQATVFVIGSNVLAWTLALAIVEIF